MHMEEQFTVAYHIHSRIARRPKLQSVRFLVITKVLL